MAKISKNRKKSVIINVVLILTIVISGTYLLYSLNQLQNNMEGKTAGAPASEVIG